MRRPFLVTLILVIINAFIIINFNILYIIIFNSSFILASLFFKEEKLLPFIIFSLVFSYIFISYINQDINYYKNELTIEGKVIEYKIGSIKKIILKTNNIKNDGKDYSFKTKILFSYEDNIEDIIGKNITIKTRINKAFVNTNPGMFNYKEYLASDNIRYVGKLNKNDILDIKENPFNYNKLIYISRKEIGNKFASIYSGKSLGFIKGFIYGDKSDIEKNELNKFYNVGLGHILVVSGLHFGIMYLIILKVLSRFRISIYNKLFIINLVLFLMLVITGFKISAIRAYIIIIISESIFIFNRRLDILNFLSFIALINLVINPFLIYSLSFQLSFGAIFSIALFYNKLPNKLPKTIRLILSVQVILFFINVISFSKFNLSTFLINIPTNIIVTFLYMLILLNFVLFKLQIITIVIDKIIYLIYFMVDFFNEIDFLEIKISNFSLIQSILILTVFFLIIYKKENNKIKSKHIVFVILFFLIIMNISTILNEDLYIKFYDVKSGDSSIIITPHNNKILIDTGRKDNYELIGDILLKDGIKNIDALFLTHNHNDHIGGVKNLLKSHKVKKLFLSSTSEKNEDIIELLNIIDKSTDVVYLKCGDKVEIDEITFNILNPKKSIGLNENNQSLVFDLTYKNKKIIFTGDIEKQGEKNILDEIGKNYDILKVAHHGSNTSSIEEFINKSKPEYSIIQVGKNDYGHPAIEVINRLKKVNSNIYRNDLNGCVIFKINNKIEIKSIIRSD